MPPVALLTSLVLAAAAPTLTLEPCRTGGVASSARCGTLEVWEDREAKAGRRIALNVVVVPSIAASPAPDPLFFLAGGPGQAATEVAESVLPLFKEVRESRDLVFVDQRGTGSSNALDCPALQEPTDFSEQLDAQDIPPDELRACLADLDADPKLYATPQAMDDLDDVRAALGYERVNLYGGSYGTRAALVYMRRHAARVRTAVLDGSAPVAMRLPLPTGEDGQRALDRLFDDCEKNETCAAAFPELRDAWRRLLARLEETPARVVIAHPRTTRRTEVTLDADAVAAGVRAALYNADLASLLPLAITRAEAGDWAPFAGLTHLYAESMDVSLGMFLSVVCAEDVPRISPEERAAALVGSPLGRAGVRAIVDACEVWPAAKLPETYFEPVRSDVPTLLLSGEVDPVTPPRWGDEVKKGLSRALHVVAPGTGHGVVSRGCAPRVIARFVDAGDVAGLDVACLESLSRPPAFVTPNGHVPVPP